MQAKILGPGGFFDQKWFAEFLATTGPNVVDAVTHHVYNLGAGQRVQVYAILVFNSYMSIWLRTPIHLVVLAVYHKIIILTISSWVHSPYDGLRISIREFCL